MDGEAAPREKRYWVYILRCADGTLYTGITNDVPRRLAAHNSGRGAKYTRGRGRWSWSTGRRAGKNRPPSGGRRPSSACPGRKSCG